MSNALVYLRTTALLYIYLAIIFPFNASLHLSADALLNSSLVVPTCKRRQVWLLVKDMIRKFTSVLDKIPLESLLWSHWNRILDMN